MARIRIRSDVRLDASMWDGLMITKNWTTVEDEDVEELLRSTYKGAPVFEVEEPPVEVDEADTDVLVTDAEPTEIIMEDESDGTE